ncbi:MAG: hypothetical protein ACREPR_16925 [Brasilonema sp.]
MTPETIRVVSQLRGEFYTLFAAEMKVPVNITKDNSSASHRSMAFWIDDRQQLNYLLVYAHTAPDESVPKRPFLLRVAVNKGAGIVATSRWRKDCRGLNQSWHFELTLLPEEILDFLPWIVSLVKSHNQCSALFVKTPPHPFHFQMSHALLLDDAWTQKAWQHRTDKSIAVPELMVSSRL